MPCCGAGLRLAEADAVLMALHEAGLACRLDRSAADDPSAIARPHCPHRRRRAGAPAAGQCCPAPPPTSRRSLSPSAPRASPRWSPGRRARKALPPTCLPELPLVIATTEGQQILVLDYGVSQAVAEPIFAFVNKERRTAAVLRKTTVENLALLDRLTAPTELDRTGRCIADLAARAGPSNRMWYGG